ncbi:hypothetical protein M5K25_016831 [Dendrobium thyrsiflorum]|uniref:Uncharacterized protein n=1 Tax=Dendrobium thyrsiflorum TaxID=117978 RepID=A0ABD0UL73_DENTH
MPKSPQFLPTCCKQDYPVATLLSRNFWTLSGDAIASKLWKLAVLCFPAGCPLIPAPADCCLAARKIVSCCLEEFCSSKQHQVECPKYPGFCIARQRKDYPFIEIFHSPEEETLDLKHFLSNWYQSIDPGLLAAEFLKFQR